MALQKDDPSKLPTPLTPQSLMQDPAYQAFLRTSGIQEQLDMANEVERIDRINRARDLRLQGLEESGEQQREAISGDAEARGMFRSGQRLTDIGRQERNQLREQSGARLGAEEAVSDVRNASLEAALGREQQGGELLAGLATKYGEEQGSTLTPADEAALTSSVPALTPLPATTSTSLATQRLQRGGGGGGGLKYKAAF
jgi:hypothetical protein